jgi:hypothetical protein
MIVETEFALGDILEKISFFTAAPRRDVAPQRLYIGFKDVAVQRLYSRLVYYQNTVNMIRHHNKFF